MFALEKPHLRPDTIRTEKPMYIRDQLQSIQKSMASADKLAAEKALDFCSKHKLFSSTHFADTLNHFKQKQPKAIRQRSLPKITPLDEVNRSKLKTKAQIRDIKTYQCILKGGNP